MRAIRPAECAARLPLAPPTTARALVRRGSGAGTASPSAFRVAPWRSLTMSCLLLLALLAQRAVADRTLVVRSEWRGGRVTISDGEYRQLRGDDMAGGQHFYEDGLYHVWQERMASRRRFGPSGVCRSLCTSRLLAHRSHRLSRSRTCGTDECGPDEVCRLLLECSEADAPAKAARSGTTALASARVAPRWPTSRAHWRCQRKQLGALVRHKSLRSNADLTRSRTGSATWRRSTSIRTVKGKTGGTYRQCQASTFRGLLAFCCLTSRP